MAVLGGWFFFKMGSKDRRNQLVQSTIDQLNFEDAEDLYFRHYNRLRTQMSDPVSSGISYKEADESLEVCVAAQNRMNELNMLQHGPKFKIQHRYELLNKIRVATK